MIHTLLLMAPAPNFTNQNAATPPFSAGLLTLFGWALWLAFLACVAGIVKAGGLTALSAGGHGQATAEHSKGLAIATGMAAVIGVAATIVTLVS